MKRYIERVFGREGKHARLALKTTYFAQRVGQQSAQTVGRAVVAVIDGQRHQGPSPLAIALGKFLTLMEKC